MGGGGGKKGRARGCNSVEVEKKQGIWRMKEGFTFSVGKSRKDLCRR
jgi:hypothetical protein